MPKHVDEPNDRMRLAWAEAGLCPMLIGGWKVTQHNAPKGLPRLLNAQEDAWRQLS